MPHSILLIPSLLIECSTKRLLGIDCPGCGFQRSVLCLLDGQVVASINMYPATIPILSTWIFTTLHLVFKFRWGAKVILSLFILSAFLIQIHYIYYLIYG